MGFHHIGGVRYVTDTLCRELLAFFQLASMNFLFHKKTITEMRQTWR